MGQKGNSKRKPSQNKTKIKGHNEPSGAVSTVMRDAKNQPTLIRDTDKVPTTNNSEPKKGSRK
ncbi:MAG: hypothetical protein CVU42_07400 [Chloroflexi bacterium HGW-Chloroflexi-4]|jgi:hypothetical protein|nr:MAG: hypothetical protein CVU42_07400 [Chloroflexi bacterium HGW-Chloroflexi-4]